jgi:hypothetical protein
MLVLEENKTDNKTLLSGSCTDKFFRELEDIGMYDDLSEESEQQLKVTTKTFKEEELAKFCYPQGEEVQTFYANSRSFDRNPHPNEVQAGSGIALGIKFHE